MKLPFLPLIWLLRRRAAILHLLTAVASCARGNIRGGFRDVLDALEELAGDQPEVARGIQAIEEALADYGLIDPATPLPGGRTA